MLELFVRPLVVMVTPTKLVGTHNSINYANFTLTTVKFQKLKKKIQISHTKTHTITPKKTNQYVPINEIASRTYVYVNITNAWTYLQFH